MTVKRWGGGAKRTELDGRFHDEGAGRQGAAARADSPTDVQAGSLTKAFLFLKANCEELLLLRIHTITVTRY